MACARHHPRQLRPQLPPRRPLPLLSQQKRRHRFLALIIPFVSGKLSLCETSKSDYMISYASSWELNCRDSEEFQKNCPSLCKHPECRDYWYEPEIDDTKKWRMWEQWGECSKSCGTGVRSRERKCIAPLRNPCDTGRLKY